LTELADCYFPPLAKGRQPEGWAWFVQSEDSGLPEEFVIVESAMILYPNQAPVVEEGPTTAELDEPAEVRNVFKPDGRHWTIVYEGKAITCTLRGFGAIHALIRWEMGKHHDPLTYMDLDREYAGVETRGMVDGPQCISGLTGDDSVNHGVMYTEPGFSPGRIPSTTKAKELIELLKEKEATYRARGEVKAALSCQDKIKELTFYLDNPSTQNLGKVFGLAQRTKKKIREAIKRALEQLDSKHPAAARHFEERIRFETEQVRYVSAGTQWDV
jgi:hypothetical protein